MEQRRKTEKEMLLLINGITDNEDIRHDLWVYYLSGGCYTSLPKRFNRIKYLYDAQLDRVVLNFLIHNPTSDTFLNNFTELEKTIMCMLLVGYNIGDISVHLGVTQVRVKHSVESIKQNDVWSSKWPLSDILTTMSDTV